MKDVVKDIFNNKFYSDLKEEEYIIIQNYITDLEDEVKQYEDPDDLTLFYMWLSERVTDKLETTGNNCKQLQEENKNLKQINEEHRILNGKLRKENNKLKKLIITLQKNIMELDCSDEELELLNSILQGSDE